MTVRRRNGGLGYFRRSGDRQEMSLGEQLAWAIKAAANERISLDASPADLQYMQERRLYSYKSIRLDDAVTGANMERQGFKAFLNDLSSDLSLSHGFILRRDRLARPEEAAEMLLKEKLLRRAGVTLVFSDKVVPPLARGQEDLAGDLVAMFEYYESGKFLRTLAENVILAQRRLASSGYSTGGTAPYGHVRVLFDADGRIVEELCPGRTVRQAGCHVRWVPGDSEENKAKIGFWIYILDLRHQGWGAKRIAAHLNELGIPSPGAGTIRTDQGVQHRVSGKWSPNTVADLCKNKTILGIKQHGRRSEGKHRRLGETGWRHLEDEEINSNGKPKFINNPDSLIVEASSGDGSYDNEKWQEIQSLTTRRGKAQRGVPRASDPAKYPLSCRVLDMTDGCGAVMYGSVHGGRKLYKCGRYMRTSGADCDNNAVDAEALLRVVLLSLRQLADRPGRRQRVRDALCELANREEAHDERSARELAVAGMERRIVGVRESLERAQRRLAREQDEELYQALRDEYKKLRSEMDDLETQQQAEAAQVKSAPLSPAGNVEAAMTLLDEICRLQSDGAARKDVRPKLELLGVRVGLEFVEAIKGTRRRVRKLNSGVMVLGNGTLPVETHGASRVGPGDEDNCFVGCGENKSAGEGDRLPAPADTQPDLCHREGVSLTKVSRGDRRRVEAPTEETHNAASWQGPPDLNRSQAAKGGRHESGSLT